MTITLPDALAKACRVRPGEPGDAVAGVTPSYVAAPTTVAEAADVMRVAAERDLAVVPRGAGTKLHWGAPPDRCDLLVDTRGLARVIEHAAGDLVVKVEAGLAVDDLREVLATAGQQLALDSPLPGATVGGALATATAGPRRFMYGSARDLLIGLTVVRADGVVAHSGGKVVKNVAGYDLGKLFTGSYGTLGLIVEAAFRLHPLPAAAAYVSAVAGDPAQAREMARALLHSSLAPAAIEVDGPAPTTVTVLIEGVPEGVPPRAEAARRLIGGRVEETPPAWWGALPSVGGRAAGTTSPEASAGPNDRVASADLPGGQGAPGTTRDRPGASPGGSGAAGGEDVLAEVRAVPTAVADLLTVVGEVPGARLRGSAGRGVYLAALPADGAAEALALLRRLGTAVVLTAPPALALDRWGPIPALPLMRRIKDQFDPGHRLSPGRFAGGI